MSSLIQKYATTWHNVDLLICIPLRNMWPLPIKFGSWVHTALSLLAYNSLFQFIVNDIKVKISCDILPNISINMIQLLRCNIYAGVEYCTWLYKMLIEIYDKHWCIPASWWRHQMEPFSALLAICAGNSSVSDEFPSQRPVTRSFPLTCAWINVWVNNHKTGDLRRHRSHYDVNVMIAEGYINAINKL